MPEVWSYVEFEILTGILRKSLLSTTEMSWDTSAALPKCPKTLRQHYRSVRTLRQCCRCVLGTLRQCCRSVLLPKCLTAEVSGNLILQGVKTEEKSEIWPRFRPQSPLSRFRFETELSEIHMRETLIVICIFYISCQTVCKQTELGKIVKSAVTQA